MLDFKDCYTDKLLLFVDIVISIWYNNDIRITM